MDVNVSEVNASARKNEISSIVETAIRSVGNRKAKLTINIELLD